MCIHGITDIQLLMLQLGYENRTGKPYLGHSDIWWYDDIVEQAQDLGMLPSFDIPTQLVTRVATSETFGIAPIDAQVIQSLGMRAADPIPVDRDVGLRHVLMRLSTKRLPDREFIRRLQGTVKEVAPFSQEEDLKLYRSLIETAITQPIQRGKPQSREPSLTTSAPTSSASR
jgi:hypothetical protein